ncbi:hypothetical protein BN971_04452 [Mycobacterium bohemicum DSM 44277]|uniref:Uncharacterized protein n=2 Tax=Mycobacterium bohemicum TaxID=56425 RepID=A0A1X1R5Z6_MYCBE|nr:hypothetical protein [Mycobacterium bohemicum]MCV6969299.1 hypothetical protein [Mycobacterium bohemicum]ORV00104.1 hypothetical protein AWB93_09760 [Mycobacterium bohemicum]CPR13145.1 hypothetical protein BN971_04452 [Mycobacterium bohemicum DSM 44277]
MMMLAGFAALAMATCAGYCLGRRAASTAPPWNKRTSRIALGRQATSLLAMLAARAIRRKLRREHMLPDAAQLFGRNLVMPLGLLWGGVARMRSW